jgi:hypothetical protein
MLRRARLLFALPLLCLAVPARWAAAADAPAAAVVVSTLPTAGEHIRQLALDGDADSYYASEGNAAASDLFTVVFDKPVSLKSVTATTGRPGGGDALESGFLLLSEDGKTFEAAARFADGTARAKPDGRMIRAVRIQPAEELKHPLVIREIAVESEPAVAVFKYPVEFVVDVSDAPEMQEWANTVAHICEEEYPLLCEDLKSDGWAPRRVVTMTLKRGYRGVAATSGGSITGSVKYFKAHPDDFGAMVHETVHTIQELGGRRNPGWLVEGIADYERFFKYEPGKAGPVNPERDHYDGSYRVTATFLNYVAVKYDKELVRKLNAHMRAGDYSDDLFKKITGKTVQELDDEWRESLRK